MSYSLLFLLALFIHLLCMLPRIGATKERKPQDLNRTKESSDR